MNPQKIYQPGLFDAPIKKEASVLSIEQGRLSRDAGIKKAADHANKVRSGWTEDAFKFLLKFLDNHDASFMAEDVRSYAALLDFDLPPNDRAWGQIFVRAKREGIIDRIGFAPVKNKKANCTPATVWKKIKKRD